MELALGLSIILVKFACLMSINTLTAISPVDGRYRKTTEPLSDFFSESGLIKYRIRIEIQYLLALADLPLPGIDFKELQSKRDALIEIGNQPGELLTERVKEIEKTTNHDVKAVEYVIKEQLEALGLSAYRELVHFGLTSQDINNTAVPLSIKEALEEIILPHLQHVTDKLKSLSEEWADVSMLSRTHGQPASPTKLGKELLVFVTRLESQIDSLKSIPHSAKFGGATGNFNAHCIAYPKIRWDHFSDDFVNHRLGLHRSKITTQIEHYDNLAALCDGFKRVHSILIDLCRDIWTYISLDYFKQKIKEGEVGSSAMPHKVNPIDFENAEGNLGMSNAILEHLAAKLPISRLQRDLTDSTVLRNIGVPFAHGLVSYTSILKGLNKLLLNPQAMHRDLENNWAVVAEAIQTILRRENYPNPYETLKDLTRKNTEINRETITMFINGLNLSESVKQELLAVTPHNYTGIDLA